MSSTLMTPGVYIEEKTAFGGSAVAVETSVTAFIGYTQKAVRHGKPVLGVAIRITSFAEYVEVFGEGFQPKFSLSDPKEGDTDRITVDGKEMVLRINEWNTVYLFNAIRLFYANGGNAAYIVSVGTYEGSDRVEVKASELDALQLLEKEAEPSLVVIPDAMALPEKEVYDLYQKVLAQCHKTGSRFAIFDIVNKKEKETNSEVVQRFRDAIGTNFLSYGAAYYPWLHTTIVPRQEVGVHNFDGHLKALSPGSPDYTTVTDKIRTFLNLLPPSGAMAGLYTLIDNSRGVWKAPANVSVSMVTAPAVQIGNEEQQHLNVDVMAGKSVNVIRPFPGIGTLVWGARTLDGNSQDWRYINVRRTLIMIEQSLKMAMRAYVFEPNEAITWVTIKSMMNNFLFNLWKQGALAGSSPEQAYDVQVGLGVTMTPNDVLDNYLRVTVKVAVVRPAEFIVITFQQQMQSS